MHDDSTTGIDCIGFIGICSIVFVLRCSCVEAALGTVLLLWWLLTPPLPIAPLGRTGRRMDRRPYGILSFDTLYRLRLRVTTFRIGVVKVVLQQLHMERRLISIDCHILEPL